MSQQGATCVRLHAAAPASRAVTLLLACGIGGWAAPAVAASASDQPKGVTTVQLTGAAARIAGVSCALSVGDAGRLTRQAPGVWRWTRARGDVLACDGVGVEPRDIHSEAVGESAHVVLPLDDVRSLTLDGLEREPLRIQWRREHASADVRGQASTEVIAERAVVPGAALDVATTSRVLRLVRPGNAPVTHCLGAGTEPVRIAITPARTGGEVFGRVPDPAFRPESVVLEAGAAAWTLPIDGSGCFGIAGLTAGRHALTPAYRGGLRGEPTALVVEDGKTTEVLPLPGAVAGMADVFLDELERADGAGGTLLLRHLTGDEGSPQARVVAQQPVPRDFAGPVHLSSLAPASYDASWLPAAASEEGARAGFMAVARQIVAVSLRKAAVRVRGTVRVGGAPAVGLELVFSRDGSSTRASTGADGAYAIELPEPGRYRVSLAAARYLDVAGGQEQFERGDQRFDADLPGGELTLWLVRADGAQIDGPVQVMLSPRGRFPLGGVVLPEEGDEVHFPGLDFGSYVVLAWTPEGLASEDELTVELTAEQPVQSVRVVLSPSERTLLLLDADGSPVVGARVQAGVRLLVEGPAGTFRLSGVPPGTTVHVSAPGYVPVCRVHRKEAGSEMRWILERAGPLSANIVITPRPTVPAGFLTGVAGSDCAVPVSHFGARLESRPEGALLVIPGLPPGTFEYALGSLAPIAVTVPGPPVELVQPAPGGR